MSAAYFGEMTPEQSAAVSSISVHVVRREWRLAQAWLHKEMAGWRRPQPHRSRTRPRCSSRADP